MKVKVAQPCLTLCNHGVAKHGPCNSPGQNTGVGSLSLLQGFFPTQESNGQVDSLLAEPPGKPKNTIPSPASLPDPGIKPRCPTLQADSLLAEPPGKPLLMGSEGKSL